MADLLDLLRLISGKASFALRPAEEQAFALAVDLAFQRLVDVELGVSQGVEQFQRAGYLVHTVKTQHQFGFLGIGKTEYAGHAEFALHYLPRRRLGVSPALEQIAELYAVLRHIPEKSERYVGQHAESTLRTHHYLIDVGSARLCGVIVRLYHADGRCVFLSEDYVLDFSVISGILPRAPGYRPAAYRRIFERLREMSAGVRAFRAELLYGVIQVLLELRSRHARFHGYGLIDLVERDDFVEIQAHIQRNAALDALDAPRNRGTAAVNVQRDLVLGNVCDYFFDLFLVFGIHDDVGNVFYDLFPEAHKIVHRLAVSHRQARIVVGTHVLIARYRFQIGNDLLRKLDGHVETDFVVSRFLGLAEIVVRHFEYLFHHLVKRFLGHFGFRMMPPFENFAVRTLGRPFFYPRRAEAFVRFRHRSLLFSVFLCACIPVSADCKPDSRPF